MKALLLSAGYGRRLLPLTKNKPKCLVKIDKLTMLDLWINKLEEIKISEIIINSHYLSDKVLKHIKKKHNSKNIKIIYEKKLLGTAGTLINNYKILNNEDLIMIHVDNYMEGSLKNIYKKFKMKKKNILMSLLLFETNNIKSSGIVKLKEDIIINYYEKKSKYYGNKANAGVYFLSNKAILEIIKKYYKSKDFAKEIIPKFLNRINTVETKKFFIDIGNIKSLNKARKYAYNIKKNYK